MISYNPPIFGGILITFIQNIGRYISKPSKTHIIIAVINTGVDEITILVLDILKAISMQVSVRRWEMHMIASYGFGWGYKKSR